MSMTNFPAMLFSENTGWDDIDHAHHSRKWFFRTLVLPLSVLPPLLYAYAERSYPGVIFPLLLPELTTGQLIVSAAAFYLAQLMMVGYLAMLIQRMALARDHDPGPDGPYGLATIAIFPFWISSLAMLVPSLGFNLVMTGAAALASVILIRHGVRPLLHIPNEKVAHEVADTATIAGIAAWIGVIVMVAMVLSILLVNMTFV